MVKRFVGERGTKRQAFSLARALRHSDIELFRHETIQNCQRDSWKNAINSSQPVGNYPIISIAISDPT